MNFEAAIDTINRDFCNLFLAKYLKGRWGYSVGFNTVPEYLALMRKNIADWQLMNCNNTWCSMVSTSGSTCPPGYEFIDDPTYGPYCSQGGCPPGSHPFGIDPVTGATLCALCPPFSPCPPPTPTPADVLVVRVGSMTPAGTCVLNPVMSPGTCRWHWGHLNVNEILIGTFRR